MSEHNTTDRWASMIINELVEEVGALDKTPKHELIYNKELYDEKCVFDSLNPRFLRYEFGTFKDDLDDEYKDSTENLNTSVNFCEKVYKTENDMVRNKNDQGVFANVQKRTKDYNLKYNNKFIKETAEVTTDSTEKTTDIEMKSDGICTAEITENFKDGVTLIDLNEAFIQDGEKDSRKTQDYERNCRLSHSMEKMNKLYKNFSKKSLSSFSLDVSHSEYQEKKPKHSYKIGDEISRYTFEKPYLHYQNANFHEKSEAINSDLYLLGNKSKHHVNKMSLVDADLETDTDNSQKYGSRKDEESNQTECDNLMKENKTNVEQVNEEINELDQLVPHLKSSNKLNRNMQLATNCSKTVYGTDSIEFTGNVKERDNAKENTNIVTTGESSENVELKNEFVFDKITVDGQEHASYTCSKGKSKFKNTNEKIIEANYPCLVEINNETTAEIERSLNAFGKHEACRYNKPRAKEIRPDKSNITVGQKIREKEADDKTVSNLNKTDGEEISIRNQRANFVITKYRTICVKFEVIFVRPFANVLADSYELISFIFFLIVCVFYLLFDRIQLLLSNCRLPKISPDGSNVKRNVTVNSGEPILLTAVSDTMIIYENELLSTEKISSEGNEEIEKWLDINSWIQVAPEEIDLIALNYEVANEKVINSYEKVQNVSSNFCCRKQHRASIKTCAEFQVEIEYINDNEVSKKELPLPDFDEEIIASSKRLGCDMNGTGEREMDNSCIIVKFLKHDSKLTSKIKLNPDSVLTNICPENSQADAKPLFNSTEVDAFDIESNSKLRCSSHSDVSSASYMSNAENRSFEMQVSRRNSPQRCYLTSSLTVNLPSFASRSEFLSESAPSTGTSRSFHDDERMESADDTQIHSEEKREELSKYLFSPRSLHVPASENSLEATISVTKSSVKREVVESFVESNEKSSNARKSSYIQRQNSGIFSVSESADISFKENNHHSKKSSLMSGDTKFTSVLSNSNNQVHSFTKHETSLIIVEEKSKRRSSLRRRVSSVLDSWRNIQVMPSCVAKNNKSRKDCYRNDSKKDKH